MWAMYCIGLHRDIQEQLHEEILAVCGADEPVTTEHLPELQLLDRVLKESQRMYPSVPIIGRTITHPIEIVGENAKNGLQAIGIWLALEVGDFPAHIRA